METRKITNNKTYSSKKIDKALQRAKTAKPKVIRIENYTREEINICLLGCQGSGDINQSFVADLMNEVGENHPLSLIIYLGDNFYPSGAQSPTDNCFDKQFHDIYEHPVRKYINHVPGLITLGNHCARYDLKSMLFDYGLSFVKDDVMKGKEAEQQQVAHSRLLYNESIFEKDSIDYKDLPSFFLPHLFYSVIIDNLQIFILDSNSYVQDYLDYLRCEVYGEKIDYENNQAAWFAREYDIANNSGKTIMVAMHHFIYGLDKRSYKGGWDGKYYLTPLSMTRMEQLTNTIFPNDPTKNQRIKDIFETKFDLLVSNVNYNKMLRECILVHQKINPDIFLVAHSHNISYVNNKKHRSINSPEICQLTNGGGGDNSLQPRLYFNNSEILGAYFKKHGCSLISYHRNNPKKFDIRLFTKEGDVLHFNNDSNIPIQTITKEMESLRDAVLSACRKYERLLHKKQMEKNGELFNIIRTPKTKNPIFETISIFYHNYTSIHTLAEVDVMHDIINYFNQPQLHDYKKSVNFLYDVMNNLLYKEHDESLYMKLSNSLEKKLGKDIQQLYDVAYSACSASIGSKREAR